MITDFLRTRPDLEQGSVCLPWNCCRTSAGHTDGSGQTAGEGGMRTFEAGAIKTSSLKFTKPSFRVELRWLARNRKGLSLMLPGN